MSILRIKVRNCNNIVDGEIDIDRNKLNIFFGRNGTGKSTIAKAILLQSEDEPLSGLTPYGIDDKENAPGISGVPSGNIAIFNTGYVEQYIFQLGSLIKEPFKILIRSQSYDEIKEKMDQTLAKIKSTITDTEEITELLSSIKSFLDVIKLGSTGAISRRGGVKKLLEGQGAYFNPPEELKRLKPFLTGKSVIDWTDWRLRGYKNFGEEGRCPYCSIEDSDAIKTINQVFVETYDKSSVQAVSNVHRALGALRPYLDKERVAKLLSFFGSKKDLPVLNLELRKLGAEATYLHKCLMQITDFDWSSVDSDNVDELESWLGENKISVSAVADYFTSELTENVIGMINGEIEGLLENVGQLKGEVALCNNYVRRMITHRERDINEFLQLAGFRYSFEIEVDDEDNTSALLRFILPDGGDVNVQSPGENLSWGERHTIALILFMFDAISQNAELIILDDPISSYDSNKKYAIINRLFKTGDKENSLYQRTVLLLTHDFEPVLDFIQAGAGRQDSTCVKATYFENNSGQIECTPITRESNDIISSTVLLQELARDTELDFAARVGSLRKFIEHQEKWPANSAAYNILSSLIHGRTEPTVDSQGEEELTAEQMAEGLQFLRRFIPDFEYNSALEHCAPEKVMERYFSETSSYMKMLILRMYIERKPEARSRLRASNEVLLKYVDETYHVENDYLFSLDVRRFNIVPDHYVTEADRFMEEER